jgi:tripartite ATP-independent transporter DctM subunit
MSAISICFILLLIFLFMGVPVFISIFASSIAYFVLTPENSIANIVSIQRMVSGIQSIPLLAVPFFVAAGVFMNYSGVTKRVMDFCLVLTNHLSGGLAQVNVALSTLMGGMSGSSLADAAMEAKMLVPEMLKKGYPNGFASAITAASSIITPLIPPGIAAIIYGSITGTSIGKLFVAGVFPGVLLCILMMVMISIISKKKGYQPTSEKRITWQEFFTAFKRAILALFMPVIIIGGIRLGICTPTEAGAIAIVYAAILGIYYRELTWHNAIMAIKETVTATAGIMLIVGTASCFAWILTLERVPQGITQTIVSIVSNKYFFLLMINLLLLIVGMFIEATAAQIVLAPMIAPIALSYGIDPVQFGTMFIFNMALGSLSPPMGNLMFVTCAVTKCKTAEFIKASIPFYILLFIALLLITFVPFITTYFPSLIFG